MEETVPEEESKPEGPDEPDVEASKIEPDEERIEEEESLTIRRCFTIPIDLNDDIDTIHRELGSTFSSIVKVAFSDPRRYRILLETAKKLEAGMNLEKLGKLAEEREAKGIEI